jgi:hypothetical protein
VASVAAWLLTCTRSMPLYGEDTERGDLDWIG